jgi:hypothetical protein
MRYSTAVALLCASLLGAKITLAQTSGLSFAEIMPNPDGTDTKTNEYVTLKNYSTQTQTLEGDKICNISNDCYATKGEIAGGTCLKIYRTDFIFTLHNDKEQLNLFDANNNIVSQVTTGTAPSGKAWLCSESFCQWGDPRDTCDYTDIVDPDSLPPDNENENTNDNSENTSINESTESQTASNINTNSASSKKTKKVYQIFSKKDWAKVKKEMDQKNLLSFTADVQGSIAIPLNIVANNTFYLLAANQLVPVNIYPSRQADYSQLASLYQTDTRVLISQGYLKNSQGNWQLGIGKNTQLTAKHRNTPNNNQMPKNVTLKGKILRKSGQYFYLEDQDNKNIISTVFIPTVVWTKYLEQENIGVFPQLVNNKIVTANNIKGKVMEITGIKETSGNTQRIIVVRENNIQLEKESSADSQPESVEKVPAKETAAAAQLPEPDPVSPAVVQPVPAVSAERLSLTKILSQKISWMNLWTITSVKFKSWIANLF